MIEERNEQLEARINEARKEWDLACKALDIAIQNEVLAKEKYFAHIVIANQLAQSQQAAV